MSVSYMQVQCHGCKGKGWVETLAGTMVHTCPVCKGDGRARLGTVTVTDNAGGWQITTVPPDPDDTGSKDPRRPRTPHELESTTGNGESRSSDKPVNLHLHYFEYK